MKAILKRELKGYFSSPLVYVIMCIFLLVSTMYFFMYNMYGGSPELTSIYFNLNTVALFLVPILTMRLFAEEKTQRTDQLLLTSPNSISDIVFGKYLSALIIYIIMVSYTLIFAIIIDLLTTFDWPSFLILYAGAVLLGCAFISIGLFVSSALGNMVVSALVTFGILMVTYFANLIPTIFGNSKLLTTIFGFFSLSSRYESFAMGLLSLDSIIYYLSFSGIFIFLTIRVIDKKRWE